MVEPTTHTIRAETLLFWALRRERWLRRFLERLAQRRARTRALHAFARRHPRWAESLFDEHFLAGRAAPLLERCLNDEDLPTPAELAIAYAGQIAPRRLSAAAMHEAIAVAADFLRLYQTELQVYRDWRVIDVQHAVLVPLRPLVHGEDLLAQALRDPPNSEMEWLWLARQMSREYERRYCLQQALRINPESPEARRALAALGG